MKISLFYEFRCPAVGRGRRAQAVPGRPGGGRGRRQGRLLHGVAHRAPLPRGVLPLDGAGDVPGRREPAHQEHSARLRCHAPAAADQSSGPHRRAGRHADHLSNGRVEFGTAKGRRSPSWAGSTSTPPTSAVCGRRPSRSRSAAWSKIRSAGSGEHVEMPARNVIPKPPRSRTPVWVACTRRRRSTWRPKRPSAH